MRKIAPLALALLLAGCVTDGTLPSPTDKSAICKALVGPIKYNSQKLSSPRHAGPQLAPDLKTRNQIGQSLGCPQYR